MLDVNVGGLTIEFDTTIEQDAVTTSFNKAGRNALCDESLVKVHEAAVKCNLPDKLTKSLQVSSFDPAEMKNKSNFFNFVGQWQSYIDLIEMHLIAFFMMSAFTLIRVNVAPPGA